LNPGNFKLPKPYSHHSTFQYFGYIIAPSKAEAMEVFEENDEVEAGRNDEDHR
jgi:hypothetical protein